MNRHSVLALSVAAALALPIGLSSKALAITTDERQALGEAAIAGGPAMQATIAAVLKENAQDRPLLVVLDELAALLLEIGFTDEIKAEFGVALVAASRDLAAAGELPGFTALTASDAAAEAVLVKAQSDPALVEAIVARASADAGSDMPGGAASMVLASFMTASTSSLIDTANRAAVQSSVIAASGIDNGIGTSTTIGGETMGAGGGPNLDGMNLVYVQAGFRGNYAERTSRGQAISPN